MSHIGGCSPVGVVAVVLAPSRTITTTGVLGPGVFAPLAGLAHTGHAYLAPGALVPSIRSASKTPQGGSNVEIHGPVPGERLRLAGRSEAGAGGLGGGDGGGRPAPGDGRAQGSRLVHPARGLRDLRG